MNAKALVFLFGAISSAIVGLVLVCVGFCTARRYARVTGTIAGLSIATA